MANEDDEIARARRAKQGSPFLNTEQAAEYLGLSARKLQYLRSRSLGPRYRLHSRFVRYHIDDLIVWSRSTAPVATGQGAISPQHAATATNGHAGVNGETGKNAEAGPNAASGPGCAAATREASDV